MHLWLEVLLKIPDPPDTRLMIPRTTPKNLGGNALLKPAQLLAQQLYLLKDQSMLICWV
jgi:hypothetical protein